MPTISYALKPGESYATFPQRLLAFNIDFTLFLAVLFPLRLWIEQDLFLYALLLVLISLYHALSESSSWQATPGKRYARLKILSATGHRISFLQALLRIFTKYLSLILFFMGFFMIYFREDRRGLHDILVKTYVIAGQRP